MGFIGTINPQGFGRTAALPLQSKFYLIIHKLIIGDQLWQIMSTIIDTVRWFLYLMKLTFISILYVKFILIGILYTKSTNEQHLLLSCLKPFKNIRYSCLCDIFYIAWNTLICVLNTTWKTWRNHFNCIHILSNRSVFFYVNVISSAGASPKQ